MCNKDTPDHQPSSMIGRRARRTRSKTRKPKFLSLRLKISPENAQQSGEMTKTTPTAAAAHRQQQLNLFPLHPENLVDAHEENVAYFFDSADGGATTLTTLLGAGSEEDGSSQSPSLTYPYRGQDSEEGALVRTAMRNKDRDASEEKWVCYSEVVERKDEEVTSCAADLRCKVQTQQRLSLKLDYQEIMNAWSNKGPLYLPTESPQTVPDLRDDFFPYETSNQDVWGSNRGLWTVPEKSISISSNCNGGRGSSSSSIKVKEELAVSLTRGGGGGEEWNNNNKIMGQREASVLRYREKRQNRLFSKRIRYEVRKINAEKRPRMKGRFVKRS